MTRSSQLAGLRETMSCSAAAALLRVDAHQPATQQRLRPS